MAKFDYSAFKAASALDGSITQKGFLYRHDGVDWVNNGGEMAKDDRYKWLN